MFYLTVFSLNGESCHACGRVGKGYRSGPVGLWGCRRIGALARTRPAPLMVNATRPVKCTEGGLLGRLCGSWFSSSLLLNQAFQKPLDTVFFPSTPTPTSLREYVLERMWGWKSGDRPHPHTSAHSLVGSSPDSSEGHFAHLCSKAAGLDLDNLEGSGSLEEWAQAPPGWVISLWSTGFPRGSVAQPRSPPRMGVKACGGEGTSSRSGHKAPLAGISALPCGALLPLRIFSPLLQCLLPQKIAPFVGQAPSAPCPLRGPSPATRGWQPGSGH